MRKSRDAQSALVCAEAFQKLAEELIPKIWTVQEGSYRVTPPAMGEVVACATNLAFAVELYLKGLLAQLGCAVPHVHDLRSLYDAMPQPVRALIESVYDEALPDEARRMTQIDGRASFTLAKGPLEAPLWDDERLSPALPDLLKRSRDLFQSWRYVFEFSQPEGGLYQFRKFEYGMLRCAAEVLRVELTLRLEAGENPVPNRPRIQ